jgi:hypothetical protein
MSGFQLKKQYNSLAKNPANFVFARLSEQVETPNPRNLLSSCPQRIQL